MSPNENRSQGLSLPPTTDLTFSKESRSIAQIALDSESAMKTSVFYFKDPIDSPEGCAQVEN